jgi:hypothetical protein
MKFEKLGQKKFEDFRPHSIINVNAITGGTWDTDNPTAQTHDSASTNTNGNLDGITTSNYGTSMKTDHQL